MTGRRLLLPALSALLLLALYGELGWLYVHLPPSPDQSVYDYVGWRLTEGDTLYADVTDQNWPGAPGLHALATALFGVHLWTFRLFDWLVLLPLSLWVLHGAARRCGGRPAALLVLAVYPAMYAAADRWFSGQRDVLAAPLLIASGLALLRRRDGGGRRWLVAAGAGLAAAALIRPTLLLMAPLLTFWDGWFHHHRFRDWRGWVADQAVVALTCVAGLGAAAGLLWAAGGLGAFWDAAIRFNLEAYGGEDRTWGRIFGGLWHTATRPWAWYLPLAAAGLAVSLRRGRETPDDGAARAPVVLLVLVAVAALGSLLLQKKGWSYHLGPVLPVLAVGIAAALGAALEAAGRPRTPRWARAAALVLVVAVLGLGLPKKVTGVLAPQLALQEARITESEMLAGYPAGFEARGFSMADAVALAGYLETRTPAGAPVLTWGRPMVTNYLARRPLGVRFASFALVDLARPPFALAPAWAAEVDAAFEDDPPVAVVLFDRAERPHLAGLPESLATAVVERRVAAEYRPDRRFGPATVYLRHDPGPPAPRTAP
jgi:hypothetical protein